MFIFNYYGLRIFKYLTYLRIHKLCVMTTAATQAADCAGEQFRSVVKTTITNFLLFSEYAPVMQYLFSHVSPTKEACLTVLKISDLL